MAKDPSSLDPPDGTGDRTPEEASARDHTIQVQQLFVKHQTGLKAFILSLNPIFSEAEDLLQEVFLVVTRKAHDFRQGTNFMSWALTIARFKVLESFRTRRRAECPLSEAVVEALSLDLPDESYFDVRLSAVRDCLETLAPRMKEMVRLRYFAEQGPTEIAERLSRTPNSVNVALANARKLLHECVGRRLSGA